MNKNILRNSGEFCRHPQNFVIFAAIVCRILWNKCRILHGSAELGKNDFLVSNFQKLKIFNAFCRMLNNSTFPTFIMRNQTTLARSSGIKNCDFGQSNLYWWPVNKMIITGSDNRLTPGRCQAIIWTNAVILLIGPWGTHCNGISIGIGRVP